MNNLNFVNGENVLCYYKGVLYEAKCLKFRQNEQHEWEIRIHYSGFGKKWDNWVNQKDILKMNASNLAKKEELEAINSAFNVPRRRSTKAAPKRKLDSFFENVAVNDGGMNSSNSNQFELSDDLLVLLHLQNTQINERNRKLVTPARVDLVCVMDSFYKHQLNLVLPAEANNLREFVLVLEDLFNDSLEYLLTAYERKEYLEAKETKPALTPFNYFGPFHLLRLLGKVEEHFDKFVPEENRKEFWELFDDLSIFLVNNKTQFFRNMDFLEVVD